MPSRLPDDGCSTRRPIQQGRYPAASDTQHAPDGSQSARTESRSGGQADRCGPGSALRGCSSGCRPDREQVMGPGHRGLTRSQALLGVSLPWRGDRTRTHRRRPRRRGRGPPRRQGLLRRRGHARGTGAGGGRQGRRHLGPGGVARGGDGVAAPGRTALPSVRRLRRLPVAVRRLPGPAGVEATASWRGSWPIWAGSTIRRCGTRWRRGLPSATATGWTSRSRPAGPPSPGGAATCSSPSTSASCSTRRWPIWCPVSATWAKRRPSPCGWRRPPGPSWRWSTGPSPPRRRSGGAGVVQRHKGRLTPLVGSGCIVETVAGVALRVTGDAFFQNNTAGAEALVGLVDEALAPRPGETLLDAYAGGGLFGLTVGRGTAGVLAVESDPVAAEDLRHNAASAPMPVRVVEGAVEAALPHLEARWDLAVADPPRNGLGRKRGPGRRRRAPPRHRLRVLRPGLPGPRHPHCSSKPATGSSGRSRWTCSPRPSTWRPSPSSGPGEAPGGGSATPADWASP